MMIIFHFMFKMLKKPILKIELSRLLKNISSCIKCPILQNGLNENEILIFLNFELNGALKNTYVLSNYEF